MYDSYWAFLEADPKRRIIFYTVFWDMMAGISGREVGE